MIKVYDSNYRFLKLLSICRDLHTTETLNTGLKSLYFQVPCEAEYLDIIQEENYVETIDYSYIIKELILEDNNFISVYCVPNIENIKGRVFRIFDAFDMSLPQAYAYCLSLSDDWTLDYQSKKMDMVRYQLSNTTGYDMIEVLATDFGQELWFDTKKKVLSVYDRLGAEFGAFYSNELRLKKLVKQSQSYDYFTVLHPIGKDGLTIGLINNGKDYLEDFTYTNKYIEKIMIDEEIEAVEELKAKAEKYLAENCMPKASFKLSLSQLGEEVSLGDVVYLVDKIKQIKQKQRVVKIIRYPNEPEKDSVEISNLQVDFARDFVKQQKEIRKEIALIKKKLEKI